MTTASSTNPIDSTTDVAFRAWGSDISAQLLAIGLTKTGDTGQVNWATVTVVGAYSSAVSRGYEIWAFNDPLQGTAPIVFKIEYGAAAAAQPVLWITVGTGSDGAGTITGAVKSTRQSITANVANYTSGLVSRFCYVPATGFLGMGLKLNGQGSSNGVFGIFIMRNNDTTGAATANGATLFMGAATGTNYSIQLNFEASYEYVMNSSLNGRRVTFMRMTGNSFEPGACAITGPTGIGSNGFTGTFVHKGG